MTNTLTMKKKYDEFNKKTNLSPEEKAEKVLQLANETAQFMKDDYGIDKDVPILILFADESKGQEARSFLKEDGGILIFLDPSTIDMSDPKQVFNGLMYEMNHYNPTNPYVYDKSEKDLEKGYKLEEDFTGIGRKPITDSENRFYYEKIKGSDILKLGNIIYSEIDDKDLDNSLKEPDDDKFTRSYVKEYQKCHTGGKDSSCYDKVDRNANIAEKNVPRTKPGILCGKSCQEKKDKEREAKFVKAMNSEIDLSVFGGSPGALNSKLNEDMSSAVSAIQDRVPEKSKKEIQDALNQWNVTPVSDGQYLFSVNDYDNALGAFWALNGSEGLGMTSGGSLSLQEIVHTKGPGNFSLDFTGGAISLEVQAVLTGEAMQQQNVNNKFQELNN